MTYQIKTPMLAASANALMNVINGVQQQTMSVDDARTITTACGKVPAHISTDIKARLAMPKLAEIEREAEAALTAGATPSPVRKAA